MKKILITLVLCCMAAWQAHAQFAIGGHISFGGNTKSNNFTVDFRPDLSYTFGDFCAGVTLRFDFYDNPDNNDRQIGWGFTPYLQYYFWSLGRVSLLAEAGLDVARTNFYPEDRPWLFEPYLSPGLSIELTEHWSVMGYLGRVSWESQNHNWIFSLSPEGYSLAVYYTF